MKKDSVSAIYVNQVAELDFVLKTRLAVLHFWTEMGEMGLY